MVARDHPALERKNREQRMRALVREVEPLGAEADRRHAEKLEAQQRVCVLTHTVIERREIRVWPCIGRKKKKENGTVAG